MEPLVLRGFEELFNESYESSSDSSLAPPSPTRPQLQSSIATENFTEDLGFPHISISQFQYKFTIKSAFQTDEWASTTRFRPRRSLRQLRNSPGNDSDSSARLILEEMKFGVTQNSSEYPYREIPHTPITLTSPVPTMVGTNHIPAPEEKVLIEATISSLYSQAEIFYDHIFILRKALCQLWKVRRFILDIMSQYKALLLSPMDRLEVLTEKGSSGVFIAPDSCLDIHLGEMKFRCTLSNPKNTTTILPPPQWDSILERAVDFDSLHVIDSPFSDMSHWLASGYTLTSEERRMVQEMLESLEDRHTSLNRSLATLANVVDLLTQQLRALLRHMGAHSILLSPINRLPLELLGLIFQHCLPDGGWVKIGVESPPVTFQSVCRIWRDVALSTQQLWSKIKIVFTPEHPEAGRQFLCNLTTWLGHAESSPLCLRIVEDHRYFKFENRTHLSLLKHGVLSPYSERWNTLSFYGLSADYVNVIVNCLSCATTPLLKHLNFSNRSDRQLSQFRNFLDPVEFRNDSTSYWYLPQLESLEIRYSSLEMKRLTAQFQLSTLTSLTIVNVDEIGCFYIHYAEIIAACEQMNTFHLEYDDHKEGLAHLEHCKSSTPLVSHDHLMSFCIYTASPHLLLDLITLPVPTELDCGEWIESPKQSISQLCGRSGLQSELEFKGESHLVVITTSQNAFPLTAH